MYMYHYHTDISTHRCPAKAITKNMKNNIATAPVGIYIHTQLISIYFSNVQLKTKFDYIPGIKSRHIASTKSICVRDGHTLSKIIKSYSRHPKTSISIIKRKPEIFTVQIFSSYIRK